MQPLSAIARCRARQLITTLYGPDQRFSRAFFFYWRHVLGQSEDEARRNTDAELAASARAVLANLDDPNMYVLERGGDPIGMYGIRTLADHPQARPLDRVCDAHPKRYPGRRAVAHAVAVLDDHAGLGTLKAVFASIAHRALIDGFEHILFFSSDHRLARLYGRFGLEFPDHLRLPDSQHLAGVYHLTAASRERVRDLADAAGIPLIAPPRARAA